MYEATAASGYNTVISLNSSFYRPFGIAVDGNGNLFILDRTASQVWEMPYIAGSYGLPALLASGFSNPFGLALDSSGNLYVADTGHNAVKEILKAGGYSTVKTLATVPGVQSVAVDVNGNVFVAASGSNSVYEIKAVNGSIPASPTIVTLVTDPNGPQVVALDPSGNLYYGTNSGSTITKLTFASPPSLSFGSTTVGSTSSPQTVTIANNGNAPLTFPIPGSGNNPAIATNFTLDSSSEGTCPLTDSGSSEPATLAAGASCTLPVTFAPTATGTPLIGTLVLTDTNLNASPNTTQTINLSGTGTAAPPAITSINPGAGPVAGGTSVTITGTSFTGATAVRFGSAAAVSFAINSGTSITAVAPAGTVGTVDVEVVTGAGTSAAVMADKYSYDSLAAQQNAASAVLTQNHAVTAFTPVTGSGGIGTLAYSIFPALPAGLSFSTSTGAVTGTATATKANTTYTVTVTDANSATATASFSLTVNNALTATQNTASSTLTQNVAVSAFTPVTGTGGTGTLSYSISPALPTGLNFSSSTGAVTGTASVTSTTTAHTVTVTDANSATATASFSLTVNSVLTATQNTASSVLTFGQVVTAFTPVTGTGGTGTLTYSISPLLPAGLSFSTSTGAITGTATAARSATTYTVTVTDANSATATASFNLTVNNAVTATQNTASSVLTFGQVVTAFTPVTGAGGTAALSYSISPALPTGLNFSSSTGALTGTASVTSTATTYTVTVTDANSATATATFSLTVNSALTATQNTASSALTFGQVVTAFAPVTCNGGTGTLTYSIFPALPAGLSFSTSTGAITGTATATRTATTYTVTVTDANSATATASFSLTVNNATSILSGPSTQPVQLADAQAASMLVTVSGQYSGDGIGTPSGMVTYTVSGSGFESGTSSINNGTAMIPVPNTVAPGTYMVTVSYGGDGNYSAATSITITLQVSQIQPTISWTQPSAISYGTSLAGVLNALAINGGKPVDGTYRYLNGIYLVSASTVLPAGTYTLTVNFTPTDMTYKAASGGVALTVNLAGVSGVTLTGTVNPVLVTNSTTLVAAVISPLSTPTGSVSFFEENSVTPLGTAILSDGIAQLPISTLSTGTHSITAVYSGDLNFQGASSTALNEQVQDFGMTISSSAPGSDSGSSSGNSSATVNPGGTAVYSLALVPTGMSTFPSRVTLSVTGLPAGASYTLNPTSIAAGAGATNVSFTVSLPSQTAALQHAEPVRGLMPVVLGMLLLPFARRMRRSAGRLRRIAAVLLLLVAGVAGVAGMTGCGASNGHVTQPQRIYKISVVATSGTLTHSATVTLIVE